MVTIDEFRTRHPEFAQVADSTVLLWLVEGTEETASWSDATRNRGSILYAAHRIAEGGHGTGGIPAGVTSFKSGTFSATMTDAAASRVGFYSTIYGREYLRLMRRNFAGPRLAWAPLARV